MKHVSFFFCSNSITWPLLLGCPWISPKLKTYFSLCVLSLSDKPPQFTVPQLPDGKSFVVSHYLPSLTAGVLGFLRIMTSDSGSLPLKWAAVCALHQIWLLRFLFLHSWYGRHMARSAKGFDVRRIFWWLDLICRARLVGLMFNTGYHSSIHILLIGPNRIIPRVFHITQGCWGFEGQRHPTVVSPHFVIHVLILSGT